MKIKIGSGGRAHWAFKPPHAEFWVFKVARDHLGECVAEGGRVLETSAAEARSEDHPAVRPVKDELLVRRCSAHAPLRRYSDWLQGGHMISDKRHDVADDAGLDLVATLTRVWKQVVPGSTDLHAGRCPTRAVEVTVGQVEDEGWKIARCRSCEPDLRHAVRSQLRPFHKLARPGSRCNDHVVGGHITAVRLHHEPFPVGSDSEGSGLKRKLRAGGFGCGTRGVYTRLDGKTGAGWVPVAREPSTRRSKAKARDLVCTDTFEASGRGELIWTHPELSGLSKQGPTDGILERAPAGPCGLRESAAVRLRMSSPEQTGLAVRASPVVGTAVLLHAHHVIATLGKGATGSRADPAQTDDSNVCGAWQGHNGLGRSNEREAVVDPLRAVGLREVVQTLGVLVVLLRVPVDRLVSLVASVVEHVNGQREPDAFSTRALERV